VHKTQVRAAIVYLAFLILAGSIVIVDHVIASSQGGSSGYHVDKKYKLGGEGGWDYLAIDAPSHRLFISRATRVMVVDTNNGSMLGEIPGLHRSHGIALAPEFNKGFATDGNPGTVTVYDPASKRVFTMNGDANTSTAIDASTGKVVSTFPLGGGPEFAAADGKGYVFANLEDKSAMVKINSRTLKVEETWPLAPCQSPSGLAIDAANERLFVGCHSKMMAFVDGNSGKVLGTVPIGQGVDANRFDAATGFAFASCGDGTITVAHEDSPDKLSPVDMITTQRGARTMEVDPTTHAIYTVTAEFGPTPAATAENPRPRPTIMPDTFTLFVFSR
jgi:YVTN family beta-propeller protein